jgi:uroporphyrinogen-III decarboxylase
MEEMTSRERVMATMNHQEPDRVPLYSFSVDAKFIKAFGDGNALKTYEVMGLDSFPIRAQNWCQGSYIGGALKTREDIDKYIPPLKLEERTPPGVMEKYKELYPDKAYCLNSHTGPFGLTMESMGFEHFFYSLFDDRDLVKEVIKRRTQWFIDICMYAQDLGADFVVMGDDVAYKGKTFVSPDDFRELAIPHFKRIVD